MDNSHTGFILAAYAIAALVILGLLAWIVLDGIKLRKGLAEMEARGVGRRSAQAKQQEKAGP